MLYNNTNNYYFFAKKYTMHNYQQKVKENKIETTLV